MGIVSFSPFGYEGTLVTVEVDLRRGIPAVDIVGLADGTIKESRERMRAAIVNSGFDFPLERVLINLSPAGLRKEGAGFDLAVALAVLAAKTSGPDDTVLVMGELELSGKVRSVRGIHAAAATAAQTGLHITRCIVPAGNAAEAREVPGMKVCGASDLTEAFAALLHPELCTEGGETDDHGQVPEGSVDIGGVLFPAVGADMDFADINGQKELIRGLQIAAAGGHNVLAFGAPGCGKTLALQRFPSLLPLLTTGQAQPVTRIYSLAGILPPSSRLIRTAPFRMPHQTASIEGICGGGPWCRPGEISLAHNGVLFLDEAAEFKTSVLQMLRVPLETGAITLSRAGQSTVYPADFQLLMATNPCPCGNFGSRTKICLCSARSVEMYWKKFSGPLLDRIDIRIHVDAAPTSGQSDRIASGILRQGIAAAVAVQRNRLGKKNARLTVEEMKQYCTLSRQGKAVLDKAAAAFNFSARGTASCLKLARTIADMETCENIGTAHVEEAVFYRRLSGGLDMDV